MKSRDHVGELRPSQLLHTYGVGSTVELPEMTALVLGLDSWPEALCQPVSEPRLLAAVRAICGPQLEQLLSPPVVEENSSDGVPVAPFPRWLRCPLCSLLSPIDHGVFTLRRDRYRPERTTYVHEGCPKSVGRRPPTAYPARYLMACVDGHLDDFPWIEFLHGGGTCPGTLRLRELGDAGRAGDVQVSCDECGRRRRLSQAFGDESRRFLPPRCRGRHPHLGKTTGCRQTPTTLLLGASNAWFPVQSSALSIPSPGGRIAQAVDDAWSVIASFPASAEILNALLKTNPLLRELRLIADELGLDTVVAAVQAKLDGNDDSDPRDLRTPEWRVLCDPAGAPELPDFKLTAAGAPEAFRGDLAEVVLVERLREVSALRGFTRITAPDDLDQSQGKIAPLTRGAPTWLPCSEVRGEGIFLRFPEDRITAWEQRYLADPVSDQLLAAHRDWRTRRALDPDDGWPGARYVLLHSFAHALIRELALECGYTASSIRERIYSDDGSEGTEPMAGVLLYTAAPDSEGTLGGLVSLGRPENLGPLLTQALERARLCSSDPLCSEHDPRSDSSVHSAACHACQFASETSCERGNRYLDRAALVPTMAIDGYAYFALR